MQNNDSPYIYEKPLRSELKQRSKRLAGLSALGLVGMVGIFSGSAIANTVVSATTVEPTIEADADPAPLVSIPLQEARPKPNSVKIELPSLPNQSSGKTSSATPTVGSGNYSAGSAPAKFETRGESHERYESSANNNETEFEDD